MKKIIPLFSAILIVAIVIMSGGGIVFINIPSLVLIILLPMITTLTFTSLGDIGQAFKIAFRPEEYDSSAQKKSLVIQKALSKNLDYTGVIGFLIGITAMFANPMDEYFLTKGLALSLLIFVYAVIIKFVLIFPMINSLEKSLAGVPERN